MGGKRPDGTAALPLRRDRESGLSFTAQRLSFPAPRVGGEPSDGDAAWQLQRNRESGQWNSAIWLAL